MKRIILFLSCAYMFCVFNACSDDEGQIDDLTDQLETEQLEAKYRKILAQNCIPVDNFKMVGNYIYTQEHVIYDTREIDKYLDPKGGNEKALSFGDFPEDVNNVRIFITPGFNANALNAINLAIQEWNAVDDSEVNLVVIPTNTNPDITIGPDNSVDIPWCMRNWPANVLGGAFGPVNGNVGRWISINDNIFNQNVEVIRSTVQHELGHTLGFWHSNAPNVTVDLDFACGNATSPSAQIDCTLPEEADNNIMAGGMGGQVRNFSIDEIRAIIFRWPTEDWLDQYRADLIASICPSGDMDEGIPENYCAFDGGQWIDYWDECIDERFEFCCYP